MALSSERVKLLLTIAWVLTSTFVNARKTENWRKCGGDELCCARFYSPKSRPHIVTKTRLRLSFRPDDKRTLSWKMAVHPSNDIVSNFVKGSGSWEAGIAQAMLAELKGFNNLSPGVLLDVGANIGWFTTMAAVAGYSVVALEPFPENIALLHHTLCLAPEEVQNRVTLIPYGLGSQDNINCELWRHEKDNIGNAHTICNSSSTAPAIRQMKQSGYKKAATVSVHRLDTLIAEQKVQLPHNRRVVMKIDIEGFEGFAMEGAKKFLAEYTPRVIFSEYAPFMIEQAAQSMGEFVEKSLSRPRMFLDFMTAAGYNHTAITGQAIENIVFTRTE